MLKKIRLWLKKKLVKMKVLDSVVIDGTVYKIIDKTCILPNVKNTRLLRFRKDNMFYIYSAIHLNPKQHFQPFLSFVQKVISIWSKSYSLNNSLVLGCAGCAIPRFISLHYPKSNVIGVELSEDVIKVAKKYFFLEQIENQFELVKGDAIEYVKNYNLDYKQDIILIDIFCENKVVPQVFTESFINAIYNITNQNGIVIINILGENIEGVKSFFDDIKLPFENIFAVKKGNSQFFVLTKTTDIQKENRFINKLKKTKDIVVKSWD